MTILFTVRHGETESNLARQKMGQQDSPLTLRGFHQAEELALMLRQLPLPPEFVFSSDLPRAYNTANIYRDVLGIDAEHYDESKLLREVDLGDYGGYESKRIHCIDPDYKRCMHRILPHGESLSLMKARVTLYTEREILGNSARSILLVTHAGPIRALLSEYGGVDLCDLYRRPVRDRVYRFEFIEGEIEAIHKYDGTQWGEWKP